MATNHIIQHSDEQPRHVGLTGAAREWIPLKRNINIEFKIILPSGSSGSIVSDYGLDDRGSIPDIGRVFFFQTLCPDRHWGPPSLLYNRYQGVLSLGVKRGQGVTLTTHPHLLPRSRMSRSYTSSPPWTVAGQLYFYSQNIKTVFPSLALGELILFWLLIYWLWETIRFRIVMLV
jgi:hypothetical protein